MHDARLNFVLQEFIAPEYIEAERSDYLLTENQDSGYVEEPSELSGYAGAMCGLGDSHQSGVCLYDIID